MNSKQNISNTPAEDLDTKRAIAEKMIKNYRDHTRYFITAFPQTAINKLFSEIMRIYNIEKLTEQSGISKYMLLEHISSIKGDSSSILSIIDNTLHVRKQATALMELCQKVDQMVRDKNDAALLKLKNSLRIKTGEGEP